MVRQTGFTEKDCDNHIEIVAPSEDVENGLLSIPDADISSEILMGGCMAAKKELEW